jgi:hypothetical protein
VNCRLGAGGAKENTAFQFDRFSLVYVYCSVALKRDISPGGSCIAFNLLAGIILNSRLESAMQREELREKRLAQKSRNTIALLEIRLHFARQS